MEIVEKKMREISINDRIGSYGTANCHTNYNHILHDRTNVIIILKSVLIK